MSKTEDAICCAFLFGVVGFFLGPIFGGITLAILGIDPDWHVWVQVAGGGLIGAVLGGVGCWVSRWREERATR